MLAKKAINGGSQRNLAQSGKSRSHSSIHGSHDDIKPARGNVSEGIRSSIDNLKKAVSKSNLSHSKTDLAQAQQTEEQGEHYTSKLRSKSNAIDAGNKQAATAAANAQSGSKKCVVCTKTVFPMEQIVIEAGTFHKTCFRCAHC